MIPSIEAKKTTESYLLEADIGDLVTQVYSNLENIRLGLKPTYILSHPENLEDINQDSQTVQGPVHEDLELISCAIDFTLLSLYPHHKSSGREKEIIPGEFGIEAFKEDDICYRRLKAISDQIRQKANPGQTPKNQLPPISLHFESELNSIYRVMRGIEIITLTVLDEFGCTIGELLIFSGIKSGSIFQINSYIVTKNGVQQTSINYFNMEIYCTEKTNPVIAFSNLLSLIKLAEANAPKLCLTNTQ